MIYTLIKTSFIATILFTEYPKSKSIDQIDEYHGIQVSDPYRWLEKNAHNNIEVKNWIAHQQAFTENYLSSIKSRELIKKRMTNIWNYERFGVPTKNKNKYVYSKNNGLQNHSVIYIGDKIHDSSRILFDPNNWSDDGTVSLAGMSFSNNGSHVAYGISASGSDWKTWKIRTIIDNKDLEDELKWIKFNTPVFRENQDKLPIGLYYSKYPKQDKDTFSTINQQPALCYHKIGTPQSSDIIIYERPDKPHWSYYPKVSEDGNWLIINIYQGTDDRCRVLIQKLDKKGSLSKDHQIQQIIDTFENKFQYITNFGSKFLFHTDFEASRGKVILIDIESNYWDRNTWKELIPETEDTLQQVSFIGQRFFAKYLNHASTKVQVHNIDGSIEHEIKLPGIGTASGFNGKRNDSETYYSFSNFNTPPSIWKYDIQSKKEALIKKSNISINLENYETNRVFVNSKDNAKIPIFITHKKDIKLDGTNPTLLYGYGGFGISLTPYFSITRATWLEMGGIYVHACLRGGGEYGESWHKDGTKLKKQNVFDDFISCAEYLIAKKWTNTSKIAIQGGSNGGLLVGACMTQRPDLFAACLPAVGVMDMIRFPRFTIGWAWIDDYGDPDNPEEFRALYSYSPYHNIKKGTKYPSTLITTADTDDRVVPSHSFKFGAALQSAQAGNKPILLRIESKSGHGSGTPTNKRIDQASDLWAFLAKELDMDLKYD